MLTAWDAVTILRYSFGLAGTSISRPQVMCRRTLPGCVLSRRGSAPLPCPRRRGGCIPGAAGFSPLAGHGDAPGHVNRAAVAGRGDATPPGQPRRPLPPLQMRSRPTGHPRTTRPSGTYLRRSRAAISGTRPRRPRARRHAHEAPDRSGLNPSDASMLIQYPVFQIEDPQMLRQFDGIAATPVAASHFAAPTGLWSLARRGSLARAPRPNAQRSTLNACSAGNPICAICEICG
jgi:hypothetical protein